LPCLGREISTVTKKSLVVVDFALVDTHCHTRFAVTLQIIGQHQGKPSAYVERPQPGDWITNARDDSSADESHQMALHPRLQ
jgi:hypothetical protein